MAVEVTRLANGLAVATDAMPGFETTSVGVWVDAGARYESVELNGVSHMLEHMAFKGTTTRSARAIAEQIESVGGHLDAYTSREQTAYFARVLKGDVPLAVDLLSDILQRSVFNDDELARERDVVLQEIGQAQDTPDDVIFDEFQKVAFPDQPLGRTILGPPERVATFTRDELKGYMGEHYHGPRMVLAAAGAIDHGQLLRLAERAFADFPGGGEVVREPARYQGGEFRGKRKLEQTHLLLGFQAPAFGDPDYYAAQAFSTVLGGGMSSRLFQEVREKRGLTYSIYSFDHAFIDSGVFGVYAGSGASQVKDVVDVTCEQILSVCNGITEEEAARARAQHKAGIMMALESSGARCEYLGRQMLIYGHPVPTAEVVAHIDAVDAAAVVRVGRRIIASPMVLAGLGPLKHLVSYDRIASRFA